MTLTWNQKLAGAGLLALLAPLLAAVQGASPGAAARLLLGLVAFGGAAAWFVRARSGQRTSKFKATPRLNVVQRVGLSQRAGLALIEVDGKPYLVVHGDGFARIRPARLPSRVTLRPSAPEQVSPQSEGAGS